MPYISPRGLLGLKQYQYKSGGYTWLDDLHQPFWNGITERLPLWLAPNLITLLGMMGLSISYGLFLKFLPSLEGPAPWWVFLSGGVSVFVYLHLDCVDGKQARRTKSSSPLGQLFDHGCDALSVHLILTNLAGSLGMGIGLRGTLFAAGVMGPWALAHWEEYHSGTMLYGTGYWGVTEANYLVVFGHLISAAFGHEIWGGHLTHIAGIQLPWGLALRRGDVNLVLVLYGGIQQSWGCIYRTLAARKIRVPPKERGHKQLGRPNALLHLVQLNLIFSIGFCSTLEQTSSVYHARILLATYGLAYAFEMSKLIMSHMSKEPFAIDAWSTVLLSLTLLNSWLNLLPAYPLAALVNVLMLAGYLHYVISTVLEICAYLNISCFSIPLISLE